MLRSTSYPPMTTTSPKSVMNLRNVPLDSGRRDQPELKLDQPPTIVVPTQRAREGVTGHNVRYVLGFSMVAVVFVFAAIWFVVG